ncbi:poly(rC)-binding protein 3/4 [Marchantia polymorpha subsp. ruderalis]|uniref:K Homology domain-containing protein n=1 Tax=Marchantia polymorpha TaxID=3197 RepID=A0A2R6XJI2_MARPO|nr:hypothetical protein MARPO_0012s0195 [Marchantia polymorpha]BBN18626.1 hypothetical protein Mp_8g04060 [Marchantia polymorpha subsp. ruderalis]|eukprot:PTQ46273.1 hypothetical protein MARPO_0012s0195 [Marchantia polymorpha]
MCANVSSYDQNGPAVHYLPPVLLPAAQQQQQTDGLSRKRHQEQSENGGGLSKRAARTPEIMFRLLIPATKIGKVIGKQGNQIKQLREETGARIKIADPVSTIEERVVLISSRDEAVQSTSAAEDALIRVATIVVEEKTDGGPTASIGPQHHIAPNLTRLLIAGSQAGSLIGKAGTTIKDIRESSGANVRILPPDQLPVCSSALDNDRLVQIAGDIAQVQKALQMIGAKLRENPPKETVSIRAPFFLTSHPQMLIPQSGLTTYPSAARFRGQAGGVGGASFGMLAGNAGPGAAYGASVTGIPKLSTEMAIPSALMGGIIGRGGGNISQIRSISGAAVKVSGQKEGTTERTISIEGTPDQVSIAQSLVQAFLNAQ